MFEVIFKKYYGSDHIYPTFELHTFSYFKIMNTTHGSRLTDFHTKDSITLALSGYTPNYDSLITFVQTEPFSFMIGHYNKYKSFFLLLVLSYQIL